MPMSGLPSLTAYGSTITRPDGVNLLFMSTVTRDGWTRRPLVYASPDGRQWNFLSFMSAAIKDDGQSVSDKIGSPRFGAHRYVYTRPLMLKDERIVVSSAMLSAIRPAFSGPRCMRRRWRPAPGGSCRASMTGALPPTLHSSATDGCWLSTATVCAAYGVRYRTSEDGGRTWSSEVILRDDAGSWDCGYPRVIEHEKGKCLAVYYINLKGEGTLPVPHRPDSFHARISV